MIRPAASVPMRPSRLVLLALAPLAALAAPPPLGAPLVMKLDWGCDAVRAADLDGDGRTDLALLNRETGRIELLFRRAPGEKIEPRRTLRENRWEPETDDAPFRRRSLAGDPDMRALAVGDLDGDGRADLAYTGGRESLTVVFRDAAGEYAVRRTYGRQEAVQGDRTLAIAPLGGAKRPSLVMLAKEGLLVFPPLSGTGPLPEPVLYKCDTASAGALSVADLNDDGLPDIAYLSREERPELRVRFALKGGGFGPERSLKAEFSDLRLGVRVPAPSGASGYAAANARARRVEVVALRDDPAPWGDAEYAAPARLALSTLLKSPAAVTALDTGDGSPALVAADPRGAKLRVFRSAANGADFGEGEDLPTFSGITALAAGRFDGKSPSLLELSDKEGVLGHAVLAAKGRPTFPDEVKLDAQPVALAAAEFSGDGRAEAAVITRTEKGAAKLLTLRLGDTGAFAVKHTLDLGEFRRDLDGLLAGDLDGDGRPDLVLLVAREPARLFLNRGAGRFEEIAKNSAQRKALLSGVSFADLGFGDLAGDGKSALLVAAQGFVRALRADAAGELVVVAQANTRRPTDKLKCPVVVKLDGGRPGLLGYNDGDRGLEWLAPDAAGVFRHRRTVETGALEPAGLLTLPGATPDLPLLVHIAKDRLAVSDLHRAGPRIVTLDRFETDLPATVFDTVEVGDFTGAGAADIALLDTRSHRMEIISRSEGDRWRSVTHFELFDENPFYRGRRNAGSEPHDGTVADISAKGASDLVLLMHDRVLVYPRTPAAK